MSRSRRGATAAAALRGLLAAAALAGCAGNAGEPGEDAFNFEGNWSAVLTVVSTNGALLDGDCAQLAVGDQVRSTLAISQDGDSIVITVVAPDTWPSFRLIGRVERDGAEDLFDGTGELATGCSDDVRFGINGAKVDDDTLAAELSGTRSGLSGKMVLSATRT